MVNDRGSIKWTSLMLPEHVQLLKDLWEADKKMTKPIIDSQQMEEINHYLQHSYNQHTDITITLFQNANIAQYTGRVKKIDPINKSITFQINEDNKNKIIYFNQILSVN